MAPRVGCEATDLGRSAAGPYTCQRIVPSLKARRLGAFRAPSLPRCCSADQSWRHLRTGHIAGNTVRCRAYASAAVAARHESLALAVPSDSEHEEHAKEPHDNEPCYERPVPPAFGRGITYHRHLHGRRGTHHGDRRTLVHATGLLHRRPLRPGCLRSRQRKDSSGPLRDLNPRSENVEESAVSALFKLWDRPPPGFIMDPSDNLCLHVRTQRWITK